MLNPTKKKYLFIIYELGLKGDKVRAVDIANALNVKKASISTVIPALKDENLIERNKDGSVVFTKVGARFAGELYVKYLTLNTFFLEKLGASKESARHDAIVCLCNLTDENTENMTNYILGNTARRQADSLAASV
jgi:DtxR family Mn-dependent transcriptional regulator